MGKVGLESYNAERLSWLSVEMKESLLGGAVKSSVAKSGSAKGGSAKDGAAKVEAPFQIGKGNQDFRSVKLCKIWHPTN